MEAVGKDEAAARPKVSPAQPAGPLQPSGPAQPLSPAQASGEPASPAYSGLVPAGLAPAGPVVGAACAALPDAVAKPAVAGHDAVPGRRLDGREPLYGALDLGTNNCRLLIARPAPHGLRIVDAFSRIIRLGEGVSVTGRLGETAMDRTIDALRVCAGKLNRHRVKRARLVATEACRVAENGPQFIARVHAELGLELEILSREGEAELAVAGCVSLVDPSADYVLVFDIGGGSSELIWLDRTAAMKSAPDNSGAALSVRAQMAAWVSMPLGVVTLAEKFGGRQVTGPTFDAMVRSVMAPLEAFEAKAGMHDRIKGRPVHLLGTSGTITTIAGIQLKLPRYDRNRVDGLWLKCADVRRVTDALLAQTYEERVAEPCIGRDRADLVLAGCAILEAVVRTWPCERLRVADRGLREGILATLMHEDGVYATSRPRRSGRR